MRSFAPVLAAAEYAGASGRDLLVALAVSYQVQCRLSDEAPVRAKGFDHTTQGAYAAAAGVAKVLGLGARETANAVAIASTALSALRVTRTGALSQWKGLAYPFTAFGAVEAECRELGFDIVEISSGFVTLPVDDLVRLTRAVGKAGLKAKPEVGIQFGAGGTSTIEALEAEGTRDVGYAIELAKRHLDAGAHMIMIESEASLSRCASGGPTSSPASSPSSATSR